jgi:hypothetical protein
MGQTSIETSLAAGQGPENPWLAGFSDAVQAFMREGLPTGPSSRKGQNWLNAD